jgi:hypothetical protein
MDTDNSGGLDSQEFCTAMKKLVQQKLKFNSGLQFENRWMDINIQSCATISILHLVRRIATLLLWILLSSVISNFSQCPKARATLRTLYSVSSSSTR